MPTMRTRQAQPAFLGGKGVLARERTRARIRDFTKAD
jgi:hypothetical protein